jgi:RNA polymerase sigma-70 factor, ECF subfamily
MPQGRDVDERLLVEAAQRDPGRFADLYERNFDRVYAFVARRVRERETAEDLTSDVFHRALASLPRFEWRGAPFAAWLLRIAANVIADHSQRSAREKSLREDSAPEPIVLKEIEHRARLYRSVDRLPADQKRVIRMRFGQEKSIREIARTLKKTEGAVKQLQMRALKNLRARMSGTHG